MCIFRYLPAMLPSRSKTTAYCDKVPVRVSRRGKLQELPYWLPPIPSKIRWKVRESFLLGRIGLYFLSGRSKANCAIPEARLTVRHAHAHASMLLARFIRLTRMSEVLDCWISPTFIFLMMNNYLFYNSCWILHGDAMQRTMLFD